MNTREAQLKKLKKDIERIRKRLNKLVDQNDFEITENILDISRQLDIMISGYYKQALNY